MRSLAEAWPDEEILQQLVAKLPWSHNVRLLDRIKDRPTREWYLRAALEYGWSRDVLVLQIKSRLLIIMAEVNLSSCLASLFDMRFAKSASRAVIHAETDSRSVQHSTREVLFNGFTKRPATAPNLTSAAM